MGLRDNGVIALSALVALTAPAAASASSNGKSTVQRTQIAESVKVNVITILRIDTRNPILLADLTSQGGILWVPPTDRSNGTVPGLWESHIALSYEQIRQRIYAIDPDLSAIELVRFNNEAVLIPEGLHSQTLRATPLGGIADFRRVPNAIWNTTVEPGHLDIVRKDLDAIRRKMATFPSLTERIISFGPFD